MFLTAAPQDYGGIYNVPPNAAALDAVHSAGPYARMTLPPDNNLETLANNVKAATTTSASDRAKQIFVQAWLTVNYTSFPDGNVPRQGLYTSYRRVCDQYGIPHINTATLGKAIRLCFPAIKTRRLGVRGNSKYHYCGIRPNTAAEHDWLADYVRKSNNLNQAAQQQARANAAAARNSAAAEESRSEDDDEDDESSEGAGSASSHHSPPNGLTVNTHKRANNLSLNGNLKSPVLYHMDTSSDKTPTVNSNSALSSAQARPQSSAFGGGAAQIRRRSLQPQLDPSGLEASASPPTNGSPAPPSYLAPHLQTLSVRHLPNFPSIDEAIGPQSSSPHGVAAREVWRWFEDHLDALLESVRSFRFDQFEIHLRTFWASLSGDHREVVHAPAVAGLMAKADAIVYDEILEILRSQMLSPIPGPALHSLRQLADKMEKILLLALDHYGNTFVEPKVELGARFGHLVLRFLDIFQVTQALSRVLQSPDQLADMRRAWDSIDFESVRNQSALVCNCRHEDLVQLLEVDFLNMLDGLVRSPEPVRDVMAWADDCCERLMGTGRSSGEDRTTLSSRSVLIRWGYVTSQIMRDLTIRSDPAFGAFQILKLFLDDWIALNVLRSVALSTNSVAASVEPVIQQQFFTLSPMVGADTSNMMNHTPTTSSMLAALNDPFPAGSDPLAYSSVNGNSFSNFMDSKPGGVSDDALGGHGSMSFSDFASSASGVGNGSTNAAFDVSSFTQELVMTPSNSAVVGDEVVKDEVVG
jgi:regulatory factor X